MKRASFAANSHGLSRESMQRMAEAAVESVACMESLHQADSNVVAEVLRGCPDFTEWDHYPAEDVYDPASHAQYYFHAHPPDDRDEPDFGHFHTFLRPKGMPAGIRPAPVPDLTVPAGENDALSHLVAVSVTPAGLPHRLFTTNRWVTGETWYKAADVIAMLGRFSIELDTPSRHLNKWLTSMLVVFGPQIERLLIERDEVIDRWQADHPEANVFEDRRLEITSSLEISLFDHIEWLDRELESDLPASRMSI